MKREGSLIEKSGRLGIFLSALDSVFGFRNKIAPESPFFHIPQKTCCTLTRPTPSSV
jgi:hypothetical protein